MTKPTTSTRALEIELLRLHDELDTVRHLVEAAFNAGRYSMHGNPEGRPLDVAAMVAGDRLRDLDNAFGELRNTHFTEEQDLNGRGQKTP